jgi:hypothetical protein
VYGFQIRFLRATEQEVKTLAALAGKGVAHGQEIAFLLKIQLRPGMYAVFERL